MRRRLRAHETTRSHGPTSVASILLYSTALWYGSTKTLRLSVPCGGVDSPTQVADACHYSLPVLLLGRTIAVPGFAHGHASAGGVNDRFAMGAGDKMLNVYVRQWDQQFIPGRSNDGLRGPSLPAACSTKFIAPCPDLPRPCACRRPATS